MPDVTREQAEEELRRNAAKTTEDDLREVLAKRDEIEDKFSAKGPLGRFVTDLKLLLSLVQDYARGNYRAIPYWSIAAVVASLLYVLNPFDLIPDVIPGVGFVDDALVVGACLTMVEKDLHAYKGWKAAQSEEE